ncbi:MAG: tetratricopeptide repeat protein [Verrucomicrobiota bacterium]|nr:tetratricopeptide repeat protein [Verrucomicrobiota bacterium]
MLNNLIKFVPTLFLNKNARMLLKDIKASAQDGDRKAQFVLGLCYLQDEFSRDEAMAVKWFTKAADAGCVNAEYYLGICLKEGIGVERDLEKAKFYLQQSSASGVRKAQEAMMEISVDQSNFIDAWVYASLCGQAGADRILDFETHMNSVQKKTAARSLKSIRKHLWRNSIGLNYCQNLSKRITTYMSEYAPMGDTAFNWHSLRAYLCNFEVDWGNKRMRDDALEYGIAA